MTPYATWLATLGTLRADMPMTVRSLPISHAITYPGNVVSFGIAGTVKAAPDALEELATFTVSDPVFADGVTTWTISLTGEQTAFESVPDASGEGRVDLIFDIIMVEPGGINPRRIIGGLFPISGFVTEPA